MPNSMKIGFRRAHSITTLMGALFVASSLIFILYASYPGYLYPDSVNQLNQIHTGKFDDWHAPFSTVIWAGIHALLPGPFGYVILVNLLIWGSIAALVHVYGSRVGAWSLMVLAVPYLPGAYNMLGNVHKDILLVGWLMAASVFGYLANQEKCATQKKIIYLVMANLLIVSAFLTRLNSIFAILPLLIYVNHGLGWRRNLLIGLILLSLMPMLHTSMLKLTQSKEMNPGDSIKTYQLLGLSHMEGKNLFPGEWSEEQERKIVEACYTPVQWDTAALWGKCGFIQKELRRQKLWGSDRLTEAWINVAVQHPVALFNMMSASFYKSIYDPNSRSMFYKPNKSELFHWEVKTDPPRLSTALVQRYVISPLNDQLGRPFMYVVIAVIALGLLTCTRATVNKDGLFAIAIICSGLLNLLSYFVLTVSAEYRYFCWSSFSIYLGLLVTLFSIFFQNGRGHISLDRWLKYSVFVLVGISVGLVAASKPFPNIYRQVSLTPLDENSVTVKSLRRASIPNWMGIKMGGDVSEHEWQTDEKGLLHANKSHGVLIAVVPTQGKAIEIEMVTGRKKGSVLIESDGFSKVVDLSSSSEKIKRVYIWPTSTFSIKTNHSLWYSPIMAFLCASLSIVFLLWVDRRYRY